MAAKRDDVQADEFVVAALASDRPPKNHTGIMFWVIVAAIVAGCLSLAFAAVVAVVVWSFAGESVQLQGQLQPVNRQDVFVPHTSTIDAIHVRNGDLVHKGDLVVGLKSDEIQLECESIQRQIETSQKELLRAQQVLLRSRVAEDRLVELMAEIGTSESEITGLRSRYEIVVQQRESLQLRSPIHGEVIADQSVMTVRRPVNRGERIMTIADVDGDWQLELQMDEFLVGRLLKARAVHDRPLEVRYQLMTDGTWRNGVVAEISRSNDSTQAATVYVAVSGAELPTHLRRPGTAVTAVIAVPAKR